MLLYKSTVAAAVLIATSAGAQDQPISEARYIKACLFSSSEQLPKAPGMSVDDAAGKIERSSPDGTIVKAVFWVSAFGTKATYQFLCGYKGSQALPIQRIFVE